MNNKILGNENDIIFYNDENGNTQIEVVLQDEDVWLNVNSIANLFDVQRPAIVKHISNIYNEEELIENSTCSVLEHMRNNGTQKYKTKYYNLDMIISIGFRVNSKKAIRFRTWANKIIKDYMIQGFALNDDRFMKARKGDKEYFRRLLEGKGKISSEKSREKAEIEYEKYKVIQDKKYISDFDKLINETEKIK